MKTRPNSMTCYLAGPMTGLPEKNRFMFDKAAKTLRKMGYNVISPSELDEKDLLSKEWTQYMIRDTPWLLKADFVVLLPDWFRSRGALMEVHIAGNFGKPIFTLDQVTARGKRESTGKGV
jgi:nucleoside 2-deoxyribosyltransferase